MALFLPLVLTTLLVARSSARVRDAVDVLRVFQPHGAFRCGGEPIPLKVFTPVDAFAPGTKFQVDVYAGTTYSTRVLENVAEFAYDDGREVVIDAYDGMRAYEIAVVLRDPLPAAVVAPGFTAGVPNTVRFVVSASAQAAAPAASTPCENSASYARSRSSRCVAQSGMTRNLEHIVCDSQADCLAGQTCCDTELWTPKGAPPGTVQQSGRWNLGIVPDTFLFMCDSVGTTYGANPEFGRFPLLFTFLSAADEEKVCAPASCSVPVDLGYEDASPFELAGSCSSTCNEAEVAHSGLSSCAGKKCCTAPQPCRLPAADAIGVCAAACADSEVAISEAQGATKCMAKDALCCISFAAGGGPTDGAVEQAEGDATYPNALPTARKTHPKSKFRIVFKVATSGAGADALPQALATHIPDIEAETLEKYDKFTSSDAPSTLVAFEIDGDVFCDTLSALRRAALLLSVVDIDSEVFVAVENEYLQSVGGMLRSENSQMLRSSASAAHATLVLAAVAIAISLI